MRHLTVPPKVVAFYTERSERTIRRMCESGKLDADFVGGEWLISSAGLKRRFWRMGDDFWLRVCNDVYRNSPNDARDAYEEYLEISASERSKASNTKRK